jgi:hypothetical protein
LDKIAILIDFPSVSGVSRNRETTIHFAPQLLLRAEPFPPLTLGLLLLQGRVFLEQRRWQPELRMCQPLLSSLDIVVSLRRQRLATYAAAGISQPSSYFYADLSV